MKVVANGLLALLLVLYPLAVYFGLQYFEPRLVGLLLFFVLLIRVVFLSNLKKHAQTFAPLIVGLLLAASISIFNHEMLLRIYPVLMNVTLLSVFMWTLYSPPSMIERFARLTDPELSDEGVRYTKKLTVVWCAFFVCNGAVSTWTVFSSLAVWTLYNGLISYVLMGLLFSGEFLVRLKVKKQEALK